MGLVLPKPILSKVIERAGNYSVKAACASINGYRTSMEDAHMICAEDDVAYFGIFDGHRNEKCSEFLAQHLPARLKALKEPITAEQLENTCLELDQAFLSEGGDGGSTGTFCIVRRSGAVTIANVGDSRVLIARGGKLMFATADHKPGNDAEAARIQSCGGSVLNGRVDGDLAVSRAFGDGMFKIPNNPDPRKQKVIAVPDVTDVPCKPGDIIILACDGVFEGSLSNNDVVSFVNTQLPKCSRDLAVVAARLCDEALRHGSKDNVSCMVVQLVDGTSETKLFGAHSFVPGPPFPRNNDNCRTIYERMAQLGGMTMAEALRKRYELLKAHTGKQMSILPPVMQVAFEMSDDVDVEAEKAFFGRGPAPGNEAAFFESMAKNSK